MRKLAVLILLALFAAAPAIAQQSTAAADAPRIEFEKYTLPNGLDVILHVDRKLPIVHVNQWYHVGSKNEKEGRTGFAHLFEHMMFQGSKNATGEYFTFVERAGANLFEGGVNGTTSSDRTNYFATVPSGSLEYLLWLESDRLATLNEALDQAKLDNQIEVVRNERRQSLENQPYGRWYMLMTENLHPAGHPYSWPVIGSHEDLTAASLDDIKEFFNRYYTPNNLTLVIAGDFDKDEAKRLVEKYFGGIPAGPALDRPALFIPKLEGEKIVEVADRVPQERTYFAWPAPPAFSVDEAPLDIASTVLTDGLSSRLNKTLVYDRQLASNVSSFNFANEISGGFIVIATARPGASLAEIERVVTEEIARLAKSGPNAEEVERAKTKWEYQFVSNLERIGGFGGKADRLAMYNTYLGNPGYFDEDLARYRNVTPAAVKQAVAKWIAKPERLLLRFHPESSSRATAEMVDRTAEPALAADQTYTVPEVRTAKLSNGMDLFVVERSELPKVAVRLDTRAGSMADPAGKSGLAHMTVATIDMGTKTRKALEIEDALGDLGTELTGGAATEAALVGFEVLSRNLEPAMTIFADVVRNPTFPAEDFEREKKRHLDALAQQSNSPNAVAARIRPMILFGRDHPYGRPSQGLPSTVPSIERSDVIQFHQQYWKPGSSALTMVGDITLERAKQLAEKYFGSWSGGAAPEIEVPVVADLPRADVYLVDRQDAAQTIVTQLLPTAPPRASQDYYALRLLDAVWGGGGFGTRLNLNLREEKGYSYGVFSSFAPLRRAGAWWAGGGVQTDKTAESVVEFTNELQGIIGNKPIEQAELTTAQDRWTRGYAQQFESLGRIAQQIANTWRLELPLSELQREAEEPTRISLDQVRRAARSYVRPEESALILVGDLAKVEQGVRALDLGEVVLLDVEGNVVQR